MKHDAIPNLNEIFNYEYKSCGYFRLKGIPKLKKAPTLHGEEAIIYLYEKIKEHLEKKKEQ